MTDMWTWLQPGAKVPCSICGTPTLTSQLTECWVPGIIAEMAPGVEIMPLALIWICPNCPIVGEVKP